MSDDILTAEDQYHQLAAEARALSGSEADPYRKRQLLLAAQHYDVMASRAKQTVAKRLSRKRKTA
ncbi:MAG TPA: hypothetical protein VG328_08265 [Stellaceae bacterium]|jgi:hypothetical protein|nr:hypothetical protein [Stellaceae bacterium]